MLFTVYDIICYRLLLVLLLDIMIISKYNDNGLIMTHVRNNTHTSRHCHKIKVFHIYFMCDFNIHIIVFTRIARMHCQLFRLFRS